MKKNYKNLLLFLFFSLLTIYVKAQTKPWTGLVTGKVLDEKQKAFPYTTVSLYRAKDTLLIKGSVTDDKGEFIFQSVPEGAYLIAASQIGYQKKFTGPFIIDETNQTINIGNLIVQPELRQLNQVNITAQKPLIERKNGMLIINIASSTLAAGNSVLEILSKAPGVTVDNEGNVSLRGKAGVSIMIDNKLTYLSASQLTNLLRATNANTVQAIEIISNPSARYDAAGTGGIINIRLKKNTGYGTNGTLTAGIGYGKYYKSNAGLTLNHRSKNMNIFGSYNYSGNKEYENLIVNRSSAAAGKTTFFDQQGEQINITKNNNYKAGIDYYLNDKNILGIMVSGYVNSNKANNNISTLIGSQPLRADSTVLAQNRGKSQFNNQTYNLNYKSAIDTLGQELNVDLDYSLVHNTQQTTYNNYFYNALGTAFRAPFIFSNATPARVKILAGKVDYTYPFNPKIKLETGIKSSYVSTDNDFRSENLQNSIWTNDPTKSNRFTYKEQVSAAYANLHKDFITTTLQLGLRTELTHSEGNSISLQNIVKRNYIDFFPSVAINQTLSKDHEIGFSYSRRIDRPDYQSLNPFIYYADLYTLSQGNPALKPQYANSFELSYGYKKTTNITFGYIHTRDVITTTISTDTVKKTLLISDQNLASRSTLSMNISRPITIAGWWSTNNDATLYYSRFSSPDLAGTPFKSGKATYILNTIQTFTLSPSM
jgi:outer membrane receptor protein involved in Fe transport